MNVVLKMWTPKGTMVEILGEYDARDAQELTHNIVTVEADMLRHGFMSQRPDSVYPTYSGNITGAIVATTTHFKTGEMQKTIYLYTDNEKAKYAGFRLYPENKFYSQVAAMLDMNNTVEQAPEVAKIFPKYKAAWQPLSLSYDSAPARYADGSLVFRKDKDTGEEKSKPEYEIVRLEGFTNGNAPSPAANGNGAQRTQQAGATPDVTWDWKQLKAHYADLYGHEKHIDNTLRKLTRELFDVPKGQERAFITAATPDKIETLKAAFLSDADEKEAIMHGMNTLADTVDEGEEIPF